MQKTDRRTTMSSNEQYPARVEQFHAVAVTIYEIDGKDFLTAEDIGRCLGLAEPGIAVNKIYRRNRGELDAHICETKMVSQGDDQQREVRLFTETGANLIGMFSRTAKSKDFRLWLARLPRRVRALVNGEAVRQAFELGLEQGLRLLEDLPAEILSLEDLGQLIALRRLGFTQNEAAASLGISRDQVQYAERLLKARGLEFTPVRQGSRRKRFRALAARALCDAKQIPPGPRTAGGTPALRGEGEKGPQAGTPALPEACATGGL
jgi:prophage antirepressor-like protein/biotin operon repressor